MRAAAVSENKNAGRAGGQRGFGGGSPDAAAILQLFSKNTPF